LKFPATPQEQAAAMSSYALRSMLLGFALRSTFRYNSVTIHHATVLR